MAISAKHKTIKRGIPVPAGLQVLDVSDREASTMSEDPKVKEGASHASV